MWTYRKSVYKFNRYYSSPGDGNDSTERRDMEEIEGCDPHPTREYLHQPERLEISRPHYQILNGLFLASPKNHL